MARREGEVEREMGGRREACRYLFLNSPLGRALFLKAPKGGDHASLCRSVAASVADTKCRRHEVSQKPKSSTLQSGTEIHESLKTPDDSQNHLHSLLFEKRNNTC